MNIITSPVRKRRVLIVSDTFFIATGFAMVGRQIARYLHSTGRYDVGYLGWFHRINPDFDVSEISYYSTILDHSQCCKMPKSIHLREAGDRPYNVISIEGPNGFPRLEPISDNFCPYGHSLNEDQYSFKSFDPVVSRFQPDIVLAIGDIWMTSTMSDSKFRESFKLLRYIPIDGSPIPRKILLGGREINWLKCITDTDLTIAYCQFGMDTMNSMASRSGLADLPVTKFIYHGVDNRVYRPLGDKAGLRSKYFPMVGKDDFLITTVARNQPRKQIPKLFEALRMFLNNGWQKPGRKVWSYLNAPIRDVGWDLEDLVDMFALKEAVILNDKLQVGLGPPDNVLNEIVNSADIHVVPYTSEGFGLPCVTAGTTVVTSGGCVPIEKVRVGDLVLTDAGRFRRVTATHRRQFSGRLVTIKATGSSPFTITDNHPVLAFRGSQGKKVRSGSIEWLAAGVLSASNSYVASGHLPSNDTGVVDLLTYLPDYPTSDGFIWSGKIGDPSIVRKVQSGEPLGFLLGTFLCVGKIDGDDVIWNVGGFQEDAQLLLTNSIMKVFWCGYTLGWFDSAGTPSISIYNRYLADLFSTLYSTESSVPTLILEASLIEKKAFLRAILTCWGEFAVNGGTYHIRSIGNRQAYFPIIKLICNNLNVRSDYDSDGITIYGATAIGAGRVGYSDVPDRVSPGHSVWEYGGNYFSKVQNVSVREVEDVTVFNLDVEDDHTYLVGDLVVHNCLESMAAGLPTVGTDYSGPADWGRNVLIPIAVEGRYIEAPINVGRAVPSAPHLAEQIRMLYNSSDVCADYSRRGLELAKRLDWKKVCEEWDELIWDLEVDRN